MPHEVRPEDLSAFLDEELDKEARSRVETHVASCPECASLLERLKKASSAFQEHGSEKVPAGLLDRALRRARAKPEPSPAARRFQYALALAAAVALIMVSGLILQKYVPGLFAQIHNMIGKAAGSLGQ